MLPLGVLQPKAETDEDEDADAEDLAGVDLELPADGEEEVALQFGAEPQGSPVAGGAFLEMNKITNEMRDLQKIIRIGTVRKRSMKMNQWNLLTVLGEMKPIRNG